MSNRSKAVVLALLALVIGALLVPAAASASQTVWWGKLYSVGPHTSSTQGAQLKDNGGVGYSLVSGKNRMEWIGYDLWPASAGSWGQVKQPNSHHHHAWIGLYNMSNAPCWSNYKSDAYIYDVVGTYGWYYPPNASGNTILRAPGTTMLRWELQGAFGGDGNITYGTDIAKYYTF